MYVLVVTPSSAVTSIVMTFSPKASSTSPSATSTPSSLTAWLASTSFRTGVTVVCATPYFTLDAVVSSVRIERAEVDATEEEGPQ